MIRGPVPGKGTTDFLAKAREAWGDEMPPEVEALASAAQSRTGSAVAKEIGYSGAVVSNVISRKYAGDLAAVFAKIRGALLGETVDCPVIGQIGRDRCLAEQKKPFAATNSTRVKLFRACRTCPNRGSDAL